MTNILMYFENLSQYTELVHFQTTREGGFSQGQFASMNTGYSVGDNPEIVLRNREKIAQIVGIELNKFIFPKQCHTANIEIVTDKECGRGVYYDRNDPIATTDALITNCKNVMLCIKTADCIPLLLFDPTKHVIAAIHAGWRGTAAGITKKCIEKMQKTFNCNPENIIAGIGAGAGLCCYETKEDCYNSIATSVNEYPDFNTNKHHIDLKEINRIQLLETGVGIKNIEINSVCTICNHEQHYSNRGSGGITGRSLSGICMKAH